MFIRNILIIILILVFAAELYLVNDIIIFRYSEKAEAIKAAELIRQNPGLNNGYQSKDQKRLDSAYTDSWPTLPATQAPETKGSYTENNTLIKNSINNNEIRDEGVSELDTSLNSTKNLTVPENHSLTYNSTTLFKAKMSHGKQMMTIDNKSLIKNKSSLPLCDKIPKGLGPVPASKRKLEMVEVEKKFPEVNMGGSYSPPNCTARHRVAIIVPYRDRLQHLAVFLNHMHPFLMKQQIEYGIFIIEQEGSKEFNRAKLNNVGFLEAQRLNTKKRWQCFVFHDIDLLPLDTRNLYSCPRQPRHMSASIDKHHNKLPYDEIFGGVIAVTLKQFMRVNGFSNEYWGWGGEDDDLYIRLEKKKYHVARYSMSIARYNMLDHKKSVPSPKRYQFNSKTETFFNKDGLSNLDYELVHVFQHHLFTHILVNIDPSSAAPSLYASSTFYEIFRRAKYVLTYTIGLAFSSVGGCSTL